MKPLQLDDEALWKARFRAPIIGGTQRARLNPGRGLATSNRSGVFQQYAWDVATNTLRQLTHRPEGVLHSLLSPDGRYLYYLNDQSGREIGHFARMPWEGGELEDITPTLPPYSPAGFNFSRSNNTISLIAGTGDGFQLYCLDVAEDGSVGQPRPVYHSRALYFGGQLSYGGELVLVESTEKTGKPEFCLYVFDTQSGQKVNELWDGPDTSINPIGFIPTPGNCYVVATSNKSGTEQLLVWNPCTGERFDLAFPGIRGATRAFDLSNDGTRILFQTFNQAVQQLYIYDVMAESVTQLNHPSGTYSSAYFAPDGEIFAHLQDSTHPTRLVALDEANGSLKREVLAAGDVPAGQSWRSISFPSSDGQLIQGWLATPAGAGPFPTILETHGGPTAVQPETFHAGSQTWLDHGFAYCSINYRGSTTFGRDFENQIVGNLGHWEVEDMVAARQWLLDHHIAQPEAILLTGWSYGGYLTLMALGKYPNLWAGGMAGIAIADWAVQYEDSAELLRGYQVALLGGTPQEKPEIYAAASPITYIENVQAPVLIIQGKNDTRTPARPVQQYEAKMKALGKAIDVHWFDTGHTGAFSNTAEAIGHQERMLRFAYRVLG